MTSKRTTYSWTTPKEVTNNNPSNHSTTRWPAAADIVVYVVILFLGALQFFLYLRTDDFITGDSTYVELARSFIERRPYGFNFNRETMIPPGFPVILALLCVTVGCGHIVLVRAMPVFATLGFMVSYQLLRREQGRTVAAVSCLLLFSSPGVFFSSTRYVFSDLPYFFTSILALLLVRKLDCEKRVRNRTWLWVSLYLLVVSSLMIRSAGVALLAGIVGWLAASFCFDRKARVSRIKTFLPILVMGVAVQGLWMEWVRRNEVSEWPIEGYPKSYLSQLKVKSGNYPELGIASLSDIPSRVVRNLAGHGASLTELLVRKPIFPFWFSPGALVPVFLVLLGLVRSIWQDRGGQLHDWYFVSYEGMQLLWPWDFEWGRFLFPVAPFACLYIWRGAQTLLRFAYQKPRTAGIWGLLISIGPGVSSVIYSPGSGSVQAVLSVVFWAILTTFSAWLACASPSRIRMAINSIQSSSRGKLSAWGRSISLPQMLGIVTLAILMGVGIAMQLQIGWENLTFDFRNPYVEAAKWIRSNTAETAVVMARKMDLVHHHSRRKVIWFPPSSNPQILMDGIRKHKVEWIVVGDGTYKYWLPTDTDCFEALARAYPKSFRLAHGDPNHRIYSVLAEFTESSTRSSEPLLSAVPKSLDLHPQPCLMVGAKLFPHCISY